MQGRILNKLAKLIEKWQRDPSVKLSIIEELNGLPHLQVKPLHCPSFFFFFLFFSFLFFQGAGGQGQTQKFVEKAHQSMSPVKTVEVNREVQDNGLFRIGSALILLKGVTHRQVEKQIQEGREFQSLPVKGMKE